MTFAIRVPVLAALIGLAACVDPGAEPADPPSNDVAAAPALVAAPTDVVHPDGRVFYVVTLRRDALDAFVHVHRRDPGFPAYHPPGASSLVRAIERDHGINVDGMTSQLRFSFAAYLTPAQVTSLAGDRRVERLAKDRWMKLSAPVWTATQAPGGTEVIGWGTQAMGGAVMGSKTKGSPRPRVYVLDSGIQPHVDLNLVAAVNAQDPTNPRHGCYEHANHVAGIIGARADGQGIRGVAAGVELVSVSIQTSNLVSYPDDHPEGCLDALDFNIGYPGYFLTRGLEWIKVQVEASGTAGIINISSNDGFFKTAEVEADIAEVAMPSGSYKGSLVVQSAGNGAVDACSVSYGSGAAGDGVIVVGAINDHGQPVRPLNGIDGFQNGSSVADEPGSNHGGCIEAWAPGSNILSTWKHGTYAYLSGTSMAAPHVAGLAATLWQPTMTSLDLEAAVTSQAVMKPLGSFDPAHPGIELRMPSTAASPAGGVYSVPYAELFAGSPVTENDSSPNNTLTFALDDSFSGPVTLYIDSTGSGTGCDLRRRRALPNEPWTAIGGIAPTQIVSPATWTPGTWEIGSSRCPSAHATVIAGRPRGYWTINSERQPADAQRTFLASTSAVLAFEAELSQSCELGAWVVRTGPFDSYEESLPGYPRTVVTAQNPIGLTRVPGTYKYLSTCSDEHLNVSYRHLTVVITDTNRIDPVNGSWWNPQRSGNGLDLRVVDNAIHMTWHTYTASGMPTWYLATLTRQGGTWMGDLRRYQWNGSAATPATVGTTRIDLGSTTTGVLRWTMGNQSGAEPIERFYFANGAPANVPSLSGLWYVPTNSGWGVTIDTQGDLHYVVLDVFDNSGNPTWVFGVAPGGGAQVDIELTGTIGHNLCPACTGTTTYDTWPAGTMNIDLSRLGSNRAYTNIDAALYSGTWPRNVDLARIVGP